jgi:hypothetical protein
MGTTELSFRLIKESECPFYGVGDEVKLSGNGLLLRLEGENTFISQAIVRFPSSKESCRILIGDLTNLLIQYENIDKIPPIELDCSGCSGSAKLQHIKAKTISQETSPKSPVDNIGIAASLLQNFSIFRSIDEYNLRDIISLLKLKKYSKGTTIIKKGDGQKPIYYPVRGC